VTALDRLRRKQPRQQFASLLEGRVGLQQLERSLADFYNLGYFDGRASVAEALAAAESAADRYYRRAFEPACRRPVIPEMSFAQLCRIRGEFARAERVEEGLASRFARAVGAA
jgi:hypothetical protein